MDMELLMMALAFAGLAITVGCMTTGNGEKRKSGWTVENGNLSVFITEAGGHMAPVMFYRDTDEPVQPYYISPWQQEDLEVSDPVLAPLRGDFFCLPFGANAEPCKGRQYTGHGESASSIWERVAEERNGKITELTLVMKAKLDPGKVTKKVYVVDGRNVVYDTHIIEGYSGGMPLGHHATLAVPEREGAMKVDVGRFDLGMTNPTLFSDPKNREYQSLAIGGEFDDLSRVPLIWKEPAYGDCSSYPRRRGFCDLLSVFKKPADTPAWTTATYPDEGYLWFSLKDAAVLPATVFWISNCGRHGSPWNGRNRCLGLEDVCAFFAAGVVESNGPNSVKDAGFPTTVELSPDAPTAVNYIQGVAKIPEGFDRVKDVRFGKNEVTFASASGKEVRVEVNHDFLRTGRPGGES